MEQTETLLQSLQFSSSKMCLLHLTEIHPGSRALVSLVRNFHRQGSFKDRNLLSQLWRLEGWDQGASVAGFRWEPSCRFAHTAGCREDTGGSSSLLSLLIRVQIPSTGLLPNDFTQPYLSPKGPHLLTPSHCGLGFQYMSFMGTQSVHNICDSLRLWYANMNNFNTIF